MLLAPILFFGGKGGVGKTTLATATALRLAQEGKDVLLVSTDPAHNLGHIWDAALSDVPTTVRPHLSAVELDPARATEEHLGDVGKQMRRFMPERLHREVNRQLDLARHSPGTHEAAMLERIAELIEDRADYDHIVFDTAPSGHTSRLMALPEIMAAYTDGLLARREKSDKFGAVVRGMTSAEKSVSTSSMDPVDRRNQEIRSTLLTRRRRFERLRTALTSASTTTFYLVLTADRTPVLETAEFFEELTANGVHVGGLVVNRRTPDSQDAFLAQRRASEDEALALLAQALPGQPIVEIPWLPHEVSTPEVLTALADSLPQSL
ncbi:ArsA family ATPase [Corynebacterium minutissimum]|uniref:Arsenical pump-driving ATPase n=1 Tax=Corynebacterium minutissimum TaxID=38301 RepID=A0A376D487_9CORY|nr:ArsA family ATPase [Corynebacterium minutissimum]QRP61924.1 ArsA family ATPase [Corynebacterium minutissimum]STC81673.1 arsenical pump-driving ATPase [Corynebacterium minutissimum]